MPVAAVGPTEGATFNDPTGEELAQTRIIDRLMRAIDATPTGSTIRMAMFTFSIEDVATKLIQAYRRGVNVRLILDDHEIRPAWERVVAEIGSNPTKPSFAVTCFRSCMSDEDPSWMHAKIYLFSVSGTASRVVMVSSANPTWTQAQRGWNDAYTSVGDTTIYNAFKKYFEDMTKGSRQATQSDASPDYYFTATSSRHKAYFFPIGGSGNDDDPYYGILSNIKCRGTATGYGSSGRTVVKVAMFQWSDRRVSLAQKLWTLDDAGCHVEIIYNPFEMDPEVVAALTKPGGRNGGPVLRQAWVDHNDDGVADAYVHNKYILVNGIYGSDTSSRLVFAGSGNFTNNALHYSNETLLRISGTATYKAYYAQFVKLREWAKAQATPTVATGGPDRPAFVEGLAPADF